VPLPNGVSKNVGSMIVRMSWRGLDCYGRGERINHVSWNGNPPERNGGTSVVAEDLAAAAAQKRATDGETALPSPLPKINPKKR